MKIDTQKLKTILKELADVYPYYLEPHKFMSIGDDVGGEAEFDGHLLYLAEKGLIITDMVWDSNQKAYQLSAGKTRISSAGLDYLAGQ
ncbi:hypothetical protein N5J74_08420 [Enterobacter asburiae]|nr:MULTISPECIES: hypothetical protein [Enterobacter]MBE4861310.1 hypothetical protein [Enterobacter cloacae complex sp. S3]MDU4483556.1 hypothetical protein [Enterobacter sp.]BBW47221.1 hypothetical protein STN0717ENT73_35350 [Enterobacter cloacae]EKS6751983.1 hypothetical protein [Enterobacter asburiae]EUL35587.1 hypothetical protein P852_03327 [Enterobacter asburiae]